jgi:hypothetical protein
MAVHYADCSLGAVTIEEREEMKRCLVILFPYFVIQFVLEHPWPFIIFCMVWIVIAMARKKYWHED